MFERYAIFVTPTDALADFGAAWLGWDSAIGNPVQHPDVAGVDVGSVTATPRKYGFHATLKAPFHLAQGVDFAELQSTAANFANNHPAFDMGALELRHDSGFVALRPENNPLQLQDFAAATVKAFDPFRAALTDTDIARRRKTPLTTRQDQQMLNWGYPFVFDDFNFHMTLSGPLPPDIAALVIAALQPVLRPIVPNPYRIDAITLMGQDGAGMFHQIHRYALTG
jgi:hypothetical protein